jgi:hypothetical protein
MGIQNKDTKAIARLNAAQHLIFFSAWAIIVLGVLVFGQSNPFLGLSLIFWGLMDKILKRKPILTAKILKLVIFLVMVGLLCASFSLPKSMHPLFNGIKEVEKALLKKGIIASSLKPIMPFGLKDIVLAIIGGLLILFISDLLVYLVRKRRCSLRDFCLYGPILCYLLKDGSFK